MRFENIHNRAERRLEDNFANFEKLFKKFVDNSSLSSIIVSQSMRQLKKCWLPLEETFHLGYTCQVSQ